MTLVASTPGAPPTGTTQRPRVVELFAGVGGFRLGLEGAPGWGARGTGWQVVWSNQWEPSTRRQHASRCYEARFGTDGHVCEDIATVLDRVESGSDEIPEHDLLVGGAPCQDFSVARTLNQARGLVGKKGVLFWEIHRLVRLRRPPLVLLENVDRMLKSPTAQRGRDFAIMLAALSDLGYEVEWRVLNAADYGLPQKRRRVFVIARRSQSPSGAWERLFEQGTFARAFPVIAGRAGSSVDTRSLELTGDLADLTERFGDRNGATPFADAGVMRDRRVWTTRVIPDHRGERRVLGDVLEPVEAVDRRYVIDERQLDAWRYLKGAKRVLRRHRGSDTAYFYTEGAIPFPDPLDGPSRTVVTGEGGATPSRFKHVVRTADGRYRRLTPRELERLMGFPDDWTDVGLTDARRAFLMGNALVVGIVERLGQALRSEVEDRLPIAVA
jgi:DNA (cytosine-5)-methyltransferase 1